MKGLRSVLFVLVMVWVLPAVAGSACSERAAPPEHLARAAEAAVRTARALDEVDAPVALLSRVGTDLSEYGLRYSHVAFVVRDHPDGRWTVVHLLNHCNTDRSALFNEGLLNFFADDLVNFDARITWLRPAAADAVLDALSGTLPTRLHEAHYNVIARFDSDDTQNSTSWVLDLLMAAELDRSAGRRRAQSLARAQGFEPDTIRIPYTRRLAGGLFAANASFTDHPVSARLSGRYEVVTVRSILRHLARQDQVLDEREWRSGVELGRPGPA
ncbi:MAG: DUF2145 domain-containing protein [Xanthomonadales bacterium]|nr:DUF2145 domain-containing protein [Xanthomonadales bacterium]